MTLPIDQNFEATLSPEKAVVSGEQKSLLKDSAVKSQKLRSKLVSLILEDMVVDHAISGALDDVGAMLEHQAQVEGIERPKFNGQLLLRDVERVSKISFVLKLADILALPEDIVEKITDAEVSRLWFDQKKPEEKPVIKLSDDLNSLLQNIARSLTGRNNGGHSRATEHVDGGNSRAKNGKPKN